MKKLALIFVSMVCCHGLSFGKTVPASTAKTVGYNYLLQRGETQLRNADDLTLVYTSGTSEALFYVFGGNNCFVIVSADDAVTPVLAYSKNTVFGTTNIPSQVAGFLEGYNMQISFAKSHGSNGTPVTAASWDDLIHNKSNGAAAKTTATTVSPMLTTIWDQAPYYNATCPTDAAATSWGGHDVTGCVATATAQVMKFWNWPSVGIGTHSYVSSTVGYNLTAVFDTGTYNWAAMPNHVGSSNPAVARLMSDVGISVNMDYTSDESGAFVISSATGTPPYCAEYSLKNFFNYVFTLHGESRDDYDDATWNTMLKADLDNGQPIIYTGAGSAGGHCFVFDGYDATGKYHVNWGWSASSDGYYTIDALNPPALGTGGGAGGFNAQETAIFGVLPNGGGYTPTPDIYEVNNTAATAYDLPLTFTADVASTGTPGSNFHIISDEDYYKIDLPAGYRYVIQARVEDKMSHDDDLTYTVDASWSYSRDNGATWSISYDNVMPGTINFDDVAGGSVIFHVKPGIAGAVGKYTLNIPSVQRLLPVGIEQVALTDAKIFPNPASDMVTVDLAGTGAKATGVTLTDMQGRRVYAADVNNTSMVSVPVSTFAAGTYLLQVSTSAGVLDKKITVGK